MKILITNDDGIHAKGLCALSDFLISKGHEVSVVAPAAEMSATSHSISLGRQMIVTELPPREGAARWAVTGTPADCVKIAVAELNLKPDMLISGINQGSNTGVSVFYSGTIAGAREGAINGIRSMAVSLCSKSFENFEGALWAVETLLEKINWRKIPEEVLLSVCVPPVTREGIQGIVPAVQASSRFVEEFIKLEAEEGKKTYELAGYIDLLEANEQSDEEMIRNNYVAVTPYLLDITAHEVLKCIKGDLSGSLKEGDSGATGN